MAESQLISVEVFLQFRCGWNFCCWCPVLILLGICWLILSCSLWVVRPTYRQSQWQLWVVRPTVVQPTSLGCTAHVPTITVATLGCTAHGCTAHIFGLYGPRTDNHSCHCDCRYVGRTTQRLQDRINQHIPKSIKTGHQQQKFQPQRNCKKTSTEINCDSAIGQHLLQNKTCANNFNTNQFSILAKARTQFHLSTLEATLIRILKPELCRQKEFVYSLQLIHW